MGCRGTWSALFGLLWLVVSGGQGVRADEPKLLAASVLYESSTLVVPVALLSLRSESDAELRLGQTGWTTSAAWRQTLDPRVALLAGADFTPFFAHSSNLVYVQGQRDRAAEWRDTALQLALGFAVRDPSWLQVEGRALLLKEWVGGPLSPNQQAFWRAPFAGVQLDLGTVQLRSDDPFRARWDGVKAWLTGQAWSNGQRFWSRARAQLGVGRKLGRLFLNAYAVGFLVSTNNLVARELVGGAWDDLQGWALHGHPFGEFRVQRGVVGHIAVDWEVLQHWEIGARAALFGSAHELTHGQALLSRIELAGVTCTVGIATPDGAAFLGHFASLRVFASASVATLML